MDFIPQFDANVFVGFMWSMQHLNPMLYATPFSAHQLADQLADLKPTVVMAAPWDNAPLSPFYFATKIPFLRFPSGYTENAGALQMWWVRAPQPDPTGDALRYCKAQIATDEAAWIAAQVPAQ
jgi:hypothetical protein